MSTRSAIIAKIGEKYRGIYCHFDGYIEGVGHTLLKHYSDPDKVAALIALGDISSLGRDISETRAYHRDAGMEQATEGDSWQEVARYISEDRHIYVFVDPIPDVEKSGQWKYGGGGSLSAMKFMTPIERLAQLFAGIPDPTEEISRKQHGRVAAEINIDHELQVLALSDQDDSAAADAADAADAAKTAALPDHQSALRTLRGFMCKRQWSMLRDYCRPAVEEHEFFIRKAIELAGIIDAMPETKQTEGQGKAAIAHLHYFAGGQANFYITEKDCGSDDDTPEEFQSQAYGLADLFGDGGEIGYISLPEIFQSNAELDFYWTPKSLAEIRNEIRNET